MKFVSGVYRRREIINNGTRRRAYLQIALFLLPVKRFFFFLWILSDNIILLRVRFFFFPSFLLEIDVYEYNTRQYIVTWGFIIVVVVVALL